MSPQTTLTLDNDVFVVVPDSLNSISCYVLREQGDWFEDEIKFVRKLLRSGQKCIDIGANYGVFSLSIAKAVGKEGAVYAFEPATSTATLLDQSVRLNGFTQITVDRRGVSNFSGTAQLSLNENSELNEIVRDGNLNRSAETIQLTSLDEAMLEYGWQDIDFLKIDAEGEEMAILRGGIKFFESQTPLIQYEVKAGNRLSLELVPAFQQMGYDSYRLVPGLDILVPFHPNELLDSYLLNLFCCKPDQALKLSKQGKLVMPKDLAACPDGTELILRHKVHDELSELHQLPYAKQLAPRWRHGRDNVQSDLIEKAIALYAISRKDCLSTIERYAALKASLNIMIDVCNQSLTAPRILTLGRIAREFGARSLSVRAHSSLVNLSISERKIGFNEPFLAANAYFDHVDPGEHWDNWLIGSTLEELECNSSFSSYYSAAASQKRLQAIQQLGFGSSAMTRRLALINQRFNS